MKYVTGISIGIALNLYIALGSMDILMMLILPVHEHGICFHLFVSSQFLSLVLCRPHKGPMDKAKGGKD